jgi:sRNA-binding carbon storage regulator CsrA
MPFGRCARPGISCLPIQVGAPLNIEAFWLNDTITVLIAGQNQPICLVGINAPRHQKIRNAKENRNLKKLMKNTLKFFCTITDNTL